jgi:uncharacterized protein
VQRRRVPFASDLGTSGSGADGDVAELLDLSMSWVVIMVAVAAGAFAKGATGMGFPLVAVPVAAAFVGVEHAVVVIAVPNLVTSLWIVGTFRRSAPRGPALPLLLVCGAAGAVVGTVLLRAAPADGLALGMGALVVGYVVLRLASPTFELSPRVITWSAPGVGLAGGVLHGLAGMSGPLLAPFIHAWRLDRKPFVFSLGASFGLFTLVQVVTFVPVGLFTATRLAQSALAMVPTLLVMPLGIRAARRMDAVRFERIVLAIMVVMGLRLLYTGLGLDGA